MVGGEPLTPCCRWTVVVDFESRVVCGCGGPRWAYRWLATRYAAAHTASTNATPRRVVLCCVAVGLLSEVACSLLHIHTAVSRHVTASLTCNVLTGHAHSLGVPSHHSPPSPLPRCKAASRLRTPASEGHNALLRSLPDAANGSCSHARLDRTDTCRRQRRRPGCIDGLCACGQQVDWCGRGGRCAHRSGGHRRQHAPPPDLNQHAAAVRSRLTRRRVTWMRRNLHSQQYTHTHTHTSR